MAGRILVIRGGAIGDFLLTLPALHLVRDHLPDCHLEILGYKQIVALAENRFYANGSRSIEYGPMAGFFGRNSPLDEELTGYFQSFDQIISYLYDPDELFANNLARIGIKDFLRGPGKILDAGHATAQLAAPLQELAMFLDEPSLKFYPSGADLHLADKALAIFGSRRLMAVHPGSGGSHKVWPVDCWVSLITQILNSDSDLRMIICGGEADTEVLHSLRSRLAGDGIFSERLLFAEHLDLPVLGAILKRAGVFIGHDSGISHLAAAAGCKCLLLFGPTDPAIWAPPNPGVQILCAPGNKMSNLALPDVLAASFRLLNS